MTSTPITTPEAALEAAEAAADLEAAVEAFEDVRAARRQLRSARLQGDEGLGAQQRIDAAIDRLDAAAPYLRAELAEGYYLSRSQNVATGLYSLGLYVTGDARPHNHDGYVGHLAPEATWAEGDTRAMLAARRDTVAALPAHVLAA